MKVYSLKISYKDVNVIDIAYISSFNNILDVVEHGFRLMEKQLLDFAKANGMTSDDDFVADIDGKKIYVCHIAGDWVAHRED